MLTKLFLDTTVIFDYSDPTSSTHPHAFKYMNENWIISTKVKEEIESVICRRNKLYSKLFAAINNEAVSEFNADTVFKFLIKEPASSSDQSYFKRISKYIYEKIKSKEDKMGALLYEITCLFAVLSSSINKTLFNLSNRAERIISSCTDKNLISKIHKLFKRKGRCSNDCQILSDCIDYAVPIQEVVGFITSDQEIISQRNGIIETAKKYYSLHIAPIQLYYITEQVDETYYQI